MELPETNTQSQKNPPTKLLLIILVLIISLGSGILGYYLGSNTKTSSATLSQQQQITFPTTYSTMSPTLDPTMQNWKTYTDKQYGLSFQYPPTWNVEQNADWKAPTPQPTSTNRSLTITVTGGNPHMDPIVITFDIKTKEVAWTPEEWFTYIIKQNNTPDIPYTHTTIAGYPAIKSTQTISYEEYSIIAPLPHVTAQNAQYLITFSNIGEGLHRPYPLNDPFLQQSYADFHRFLTTIKIATNQ
jgi:hypothetical protein